MNWLRTSSFFSIAAVLAFTTVIWYGAAVYLNSDVLIDKYERKKSIGILPNWLKIHGP